MEEHLSAHSYIPRSNGGLGCVHANEAAPLVPKLSIIHIDNAWNDINPNIVEIALHIPHPVEVAAANINQLATANLLEEDGQLNDQASGRHVRRADPRQTAAATVLSDPYTFSINVRKNISHVPLAQVTNIEPAQESQYVQHVDDAAAN
jgi:hypothetical protein